MFLPDLVPAPSSFSNMYSSIEYSDFSFHSIPLLTCISPHFHKRERTYHYSSSLVRMHDQNVSVSSVYGQCLLVLSLNQLVIFQEPTLRKHRNYAFVFLLIYHYPSLYLSGSFYRQFATI